MTEEVAKILTVVQDGVVPTGYTKVWHLMPEDWEDIPLSYIFKKKGQKNKGNKVKTVFTNSAVNGIIPQSEYFEKDIANSENTEGYFVVDPLDYVYNPRISENAPYGPFKRNDTGLTGIVSPLYTVLTPRKEFCDSKYLYYYLESAQWHKYAYSIANCGARFDRMNITDDELMRLPIVWPALAEQERIAEILKQCDKVIELCEKKLAETQKLKKTCLRRMFPENGAKTPNLRFFGYTNEWELSKIGMHARVLSAARVHKCEWTSTGIPFFRSSDVVSVYKGTSNEKAFISVELYEELIKTSGKLEQGDILVTGGGSIGIPYIVPDDTPLYSKDADLIWIKKSKDIDSMYLFAYLESAIFRKYIESISHVGTIAHYTIEQVKATPIELPSHDEQVHIGDFFRKLNSLIELYERELEEHKLHKKALMQLLLTGVVRTKA